MNLSFAEIGENVVAWASVQGADLVLRLTGAVVILVAGVVAIQLLRRALKMALSHFDSDRRMAAHFIMSVVVKTAWMCLALIVLSRLGVDVAPLVAGLGVTGFILGFAFQESLGSLASGLMLAFNHPFKVGDCVQIAGHEGTVVSLDMMAVTLEASDGRRIVIPNKNAWGAPIVNLTAARRGN